MSDLPRINAKTYIYPPRAEHAVPRDATEIYASQNWIAQLKYNDSHLLLRYIPVLATDSEKAEGKPDTYKIELWTRHGSKMDYTPSPELLEQLHQLPKLLNLDLNEIQVLDGGVLDRKHTAIKDTIVIWDILVLNGEHLIGTTYTERYALLSAGIPQNEKGTSNYYFHKSKNGAVTNFGLLYTDNIFLPHNFSKTDWDGLWTMIPEINADYTIGKDVKPLIEGLVYKDPTAKLTYGFREKNNGHWMSKSRVTTGRHRF